MEPLAPGTILHHMYLKRRLRRRSQGTFCEIGCGTGVLSSVLLGLGLRGVGFDLNSQGCAKNRERNAEAIRAGRYEVRNEDFLRGEADDDSFDLLISSAVIEHLSDEDEARYFRRCRERLAPAGAIVVMVPSSMKHWGVEDETTGHYRRYEFEDFPRIADSHGLEIVDLAGLTYPVSNLLLPLSDRLIERHEGQKRDLPAREQTIQSGDRHVRGKTAFPQVAGLLLNEVVLYPFHLLQMMFRRHPNSLGIYCEMVRPGSG